MKYKMQNYQDNVIKADGSHEFPSYSAKDSPLPNKNGYQLSGDLIKNPLMQF